MKSGWKTVKLSDVCDIVKGRKPNLRPTPNKGDLPYLVARYIRGLEEPEYGSPTEKGVVTLTEDDTVIICDGSNSGEIFTGLNGIMSSTMGKVVKKNEIHDPYLRHFLASTFELFNGTKTGSAIPHLDKEAFRKLEIPLPPLAEQKRIVALLDTAFAGIDEAKARAETSIQSLGTLVVSEFQSLVDEKGFERKPLPELASHTLGKMLDKKKNTGTPRPYLRNVNVRWFEFDLSDIHEMPIRDEEAARCQARKGDVLMCEGGYPGRCAIWSSDEPVFFQKALHRIRFNDKWMAEWFVNYMHSLDSSGKISEFFTGTGIQHLTGETLSKLKIPVPPKSEIEAYVKKISAIRDRTNELAENESAKLDALSELKASLLTQAFAGELTA